MSPFPPPLLHPISPNLTLISPQPQVISDPECTNSGVYWSWNGNAQRVGLGSRVLNKETGEWEFQVQGAGGAGGDIFVNQFSGMIKDERRATLAYDYSMDLVQDFM